MPKALPTAVVAGPGDEQQLKADVKAQLAELGLGGGFTSDAFDDFAPEKAKKRIGDNKKQPDKKQPQEQQGTQQQGGGGSGERRQQQSGKPDGKPGSGGGRFGKEGKPAASGGRQREGQERERPWRQSTAAAVPARRTTWPARPPSHEASTSA